DGDAPPIAEYRFTPLPIGVTAEEGLKQCSCYGYQTFDEGPGEPAGPLLEKLKRRLVRHVAGYDAAPWGWSSADVASRIGRGGAPVVPEPGPEDPLIGDVESGFRQAGFALDRPDVSAYDRITGRVAARLE